MKTGAELTVNGERLIALAAGALYWPARETLVVSDLHFEKGSHFATRGVLLPPYDTRATILRIAALVRSHRPGTVISLGDAFHDGEAEARMEAADAASLEALVSSVDWIWILGNHDPAPPFRFRGAVIQQARIGRLLFRHEPSDGASEGEIAGHLHPAARVRLETRLVRRRCFATDGARLVMPAFGAYAGGLNVVDQAFSAHFKQGLTAYVMGASGVYPFGSQALLPDIRPNSQKAAEVAATG